MLKSIDDLQDKLSAHLYVADRGLATAVFLALRLNKPLFLEGEAGVGKTEIAKVLADLLDTELIRLQCYEGLDINHAVYEWNYTRQLLEIRAHETDRQGSPLKDIFGADFLIKRPLLQAIETTREKPPVLLVDEIDRSDAEFEAYLLELLSDWQITIPEIGTLRAQNPPVVVITSNRTCEIHDALKRRCIYYWIDYPTFEKELQIVAIVLIISDGWDRGEPEVTKREMSRLRRSAFRIIWLNPLLAMPGYEPLTHRLRAALPFVDDFLRVHNLVSLENLGRRLSELNRSTPFGKPPHPARI